MKTRAALLLLAFALLPTLSPTARASDAPAALPPSDGGLSRLQEGNQRHAAGGMLHPNRCPDGRCETVSGGQHPRRANLLALGAGGQACRTRAA